MAPDLTAMIPAPYFRAAFAATDDSVDAYLDGPSAISVRKWRSVARRDFYLGLHRTDERLPGDPREMDLEMFLAAFAIGREQVDHLAAARILEVSDRSTISLESIRRFTDLLMTKRLSVWIPPSLELIQAHGLSRAGQSILDAAAPATRLIHTDEPSSTRIGGKPDLDGREWPLHDGKPLSFVAQLDLADLAKATSDLDLPMNGLLSFFYTNQWGSAPGYDPKSRSGWQVYWIPRDGRTTEPPDTLERFDRFASVNVAFRPMLTLPSRFSKALDEFGLTDDELERYDGLWWDVTGNEPHHWLGGHPDLIQGEVYDMCQLASNGIYAGDKSGYEAGRARGLLPARDEWQLLLQIWNDESAGMMWADSGCVYFCIRRQDLQERAFERSWAVMESL